MANKERRVNEMNQLCTRPDIHVVWKQRATIMGKENQAKI